MESLQNPITLATKPKPAKGRERRLEIGEEEILLQATSSTFRPIIRFALETAMRREKITSLEWSHIDLAKRCLTISDTKNTEARTVPYHPLLLPYSKIFNKYKMRRELKVILFLA